MAPTFLAPAVRVQDIVPVRSPRHERGIVWMRGEHDASTADALRATLAGADTAEGRDLVVDMSGVEFLSAATIGVLIGARGRLALRSRRLTLRAPSGVASRVLDLCHVPVRT